MQTVKYEMEIPKEIKEVIDVLEKLTELVIDKKPIAEYTMLLPAVLAAAEGINLVTEELKSQYRDEAAGYLVHKILGKLLPVK